MELYVLVDGILTVARHLETGAPAVFDNLAALNRNKHEYMHPVKFDDYKVAKMELSEIIGLDKI